MFEGGTPDMSALLAQAQRLQEELVTAQAELAEARVEGSAASGLVTATVTGTGELVAVSIKPEACDPDDAETLGDMVVAAVRDATDQAGELAAEQMNPLAGGLGGALGAPGNPPDTEGGGPPGFSLPR